MFKKNLKNVLLIIFATFALSACSTAKKSGNIEKSIKVGRFPWGVVISPN